MDAIFERSEVVNQADENNRSSALADDLYEEALDFSKPRETAFEKAAKTTNRGRFGRRGVVQRRGSRRIGGDRAGFAKARDEELDGEEGASGLFVEDTPDFIANNYLAEDEAPLPPARSRRQPPMRCQSFTANSSGPLFNVRGQTGQRNPRKLMQRSFSMAAPERSLSSTSSLSSSGFPQAANFSWANAENAHPNSDMDPLDAFRERKKHRGRRHSVAGPPAITPKTQPDSTAPIPLDLHWLTSGKGDDDQSRASADVFAMSTTPNTTSSRRKRGPNGTPVSDAGDDWIMHSGASSDFSESRRSCIFSPEEAFQRPLNNPMDDSTDDESMPSPETSFEVEKETKTPMPNTMKDSIDSRPSDEDVKYLISELRKEAKSASNGRFGKNTWSVAPPINSWPQHRRRLFLLWAKEQLGFTLQTAGNGILFLKILKERGLRMIDSLENLLKDPQKVKEPSPTESIFSSVSSLTSPTPFNHGVKAVDFESAHTQDFDDDVLVARVSALSMNETSASKTSVPPTTFQVHHKDQARLSLESLVSRKSRCSVETQGRDINFHDMMGVSPRGPRTRPPRLSFGTTVGNVSVKNCLPTIETTLSTHMNCVATPLNTEFRGWGSRPIGGRDWGASVSYSDELMKILTARFEEDCRKENVRFSFDSMHDEVCHMDEDQMYLNQREIERIERRRRNDFNKRKRMSLLANAVGAKHSLPLNNRRTMMPKLQGSPPFESLNSAVSRDETIMTTILSYCDEAELTTTLSSVSSRWFDLASIAHANLLVRSVTEVKDDPASCPPLERSWKSIHKMLPWACFIAEGGAKKVYKAFNAGEQRVEAVSVMDTHEIDSIDIVANELAVSSLLSSLVRRGTCPNFVRLHGVFTSAYPPLESHWGCPDDQYPCGDDYGRATPFTHPPSPGQGFPGRYQYIRMELINEGDAEEYIKRQPEALLPFQIARSILFQLAFAVYAAADKFSVKHYDIKMLNLFVHSMQDLQTDLVLRYGIGSHVYATRMPSNQAVIAKLADFGTADMDTASTGQPVAISHFTTLENTPPDFLILGDEAKQGHEHDCFGMGLCMLHLFTGGYPYEEIMGKVVCPKNLKKRLKEIWENESVVDYSVVRSIIYDGVDVDEDGDMIGEVDETFYDTLYRFLVLFGVPTDSFQQKSRPRVWKAIYESLLEGQNQARRKRGARSNDVAQYNRDRKRFSIQSGSNEFIARARGALGSIDGGLELLCSLCNFDPMKRATAMQVLNSKFFEDLREDPHDTHSYQDAHVQSYMNFYYGGSVAL